MSLETIISHLKTERNRIDEAISVCNDASQANQDASSATFEQITGLSVTPRLIQLSPRTGRQREGNRGIVGKRGMRNRVKAILLMAVGLLAVSIPLFAHHGNATYDGKEVTIKGTVTAWLWINPHTFLKVDVTDDKGNVVHWICENQAPSTLVNFGFNAKTFKPGDVVTVVMGATSKHSPVGRISKVILANGYVMNAEVR